MVTNTCTLLISALRIFLISVSVSDLAGLGDHFAVGVDDVDARARGAPGARRARSRPSRRAGRSSCSDAKTLTVSMSWRRRRLNTSSVSSSPSLTSSTFSARSRSAFAFLVRALGASSAVASPGSAMSSAMIAPMHLAHVGAALTLLGEVEIADGEEEAEDVRVRPVAEGAEERRGRELLLLVDVDVDDVVDVDGELDPRAAERDDARRDEALAVRVRRLPRTRRPATGAAG